MEDELRQHLATCAAAFAAATGITPATIGKRALNDNTFFARIAEGQGFTVRTYDRVVAWMSAEWPADAVWPEHIARPRAEVAA